MLPEDAIERLVRFFEHLAPENLERIGDLYAADALFKDPFNEVRGPAAIQSIFVHMFDALHEPRFVVTAQVRQGSQCFLTWDFHFRFRSFRQNVSQTVRGATHIVLNARGQVSLHRDYWDAAEELYAKLPAIGALMRWLQRRVGS